MPGEIKPIRNNIRRVKGHILNRYLRLAEKVDKADEKGKPIRGLLSPEEVEYYKNLTLVFAKSVMPKSSEITGEDGGALVLQISEAVAKKNNLNVTNSEPDTDS